jgi:hypothetical protein
VSAKASWPNRNGTRRGIEILELANKESEARPLGGAYYATRLDSLQIRAIRVPKTLISPWRARATLASVEIG